VSEPLLALRSVAGGYGVVNVLRDVSLDVHEGEIVTLLGSNGAGKSTLLKIVSGLLSPSAGDVRLGGESIAGRSPEAIARAGLVLVPEGRQLFASMTVRENLRLGAYLTRRDRAGTRERLDRVLNLFPILAERLGAPAGSLSGGQQQMLAIGRGLMAGPRLLLLDEPSLGLAPLVLKEVFDVVMGLGELGVTTVIVEQNAKMTLEVAARGYILERGRVAVSGTASELLADPAVRSAYLGFRASVVSPDEALASRQQHRPTEE
jgi:branched-chain amino acid transport system ATP-binding protein